MLLNYLLTYLLTGFLRPKPRYEIPTESLEKLLISFSEFSLCLTGDIINITRQAMFIICDGSSSQFTTQLVTRPSDSGSGSLIPQ